MMVSRETSSENDVLYEFAMTYQHPDIDQLDEYTRRYPSYADALTVLAFEFALDESLPDSESVDEQPTADPQIDAMLSRAMSRFQNLLFEIRDEEEVSASKPDLKRRAAPSGDLLAQRTPEQMQALCRHLDVSPLFLKRLRDREIRADTIPKGFVALFAEGVTAGNRGRRVSGRPAADCAASSI